MPKSNFAYFQKMLPGDVNSGTHYVLLICIGEVQEAGKCSSYLCLSFVYLHKKWPIFVQFKEKVAECVSPSKHSLRQDERLYVIFVFEFRSFFSIFRKFCFVSDQSILHMAALLHREGVLSVSRGMLPL